MSKKETDLAKQYLLEYGSAINLETLPDGLTWDWVVALPVCAEKNDFLNSVVAEVKFKNALLVVCVNRPADHEKSALWSEMNQACIQSMCQQSCENYLLTNGHRLLIFKASCDVLLLDFNQRPFDTNKGVGLARKIAADTALKLIKEEIISHPWIFSTDADVILPADYFEVITAHPESVALSLPFKHISDDETLALIQAEYDFRLKYYQAGIKFIGAAYDYIPLGSTLVVAADAYVKVRGFPQRSGGEDFYLLNKLAKLGCIVQPVEPVISIHCRFSDRVPFGTGPAIKKIKNQLDKQITLTCYHPSVFKIIKRWKKSLDSYYYTQLLLTDDHGLNAYWQVQKLLDKNLQQIKSAARWQQFVHEWLDAFKLLKTVHFLSDEFQPMAIEQLIESDVYQLIMDQ